MAVKRINADTLLELAIATLREDIAPHLPAEKRYSIAMAVNAMEIARREGSTEAESPLWAVLDEIYEPGDGNARQLSSDIRSGTIAEAKNPGLGKRLLTALEAELAIVNPRFLAARKSPGA